MKAKHYFSILLSVYVASVIIFSIGSNVIIARYFNVLLIGSYLIYFSLSSEKKFEIHSFLWFYLLFVFFSFASTFWSIDDDRSITQSVKILVISVNVLIMYNIAKYFKIEKFILYGILLGLTYNYAILLDLITYSSEYTRHFTFRFVGTSNNPNTIAIYMIFGLFISLILLEEAKNIFLKVFLILNVPIAIYGIIATASKKGILFGFLLLFIYFLLKLKSKKHVLLSIGIAISGLYILNSGLLDNIEIVDNALKRFSSFESQLGSNSATGSTGERLYLIATAYELFSHDFFSIFFGSGQATFALQNKLGLYSHNNYMEILANLGLIGLFLFYSVHLTIMKRISELKREDKTKYIMIGLIFILLLMDNALVSYAFKPTLFMFIFMVIYTDNKRLRMLDDEKRKTN